MKKGDENLSSWATKSAESRGRIEQEAPLPAENCISAGPGQNHSFKGDPAADAQDAGVFSHRREIIFDPSDSHHGCGADFPGRRPGAGAQRGFDRSDALGHDLGHTPFGHNGEEYLAMRHPDGFHHNVQSLRVVDILRVCREAAD